MLFIVAIGIAALIVVGIIWAVSYMPSNGLVTITFDDQVVETFCVTKQSDTLYSSIPTGSNALKVQLAENQGQYFWDVKTGQAFYGYAYDTGSPFSPFDKTYTPYGNLSPAVTSITVTASGCKV
jgi:hypothetical protein